MAAWGTLVDRGPQDGGGRTLGRGAQGRPGTRLSPASGIVEREVLVHRQHLFAAERAVEHHQLVD